VLHFNNSLDAVTTKKSTPGAADAVWDQLTSFLRTSGFTVVALALVIAFAAWVVGPGCNQRPHLLRRVCVAVALPVDADEVANATQLCAPLGAQLF
jgi:hypothetical protein